MQSATTSVGWISNAFPASTILLELISRTVRRLDDSTITQLQHVAKKHHLSNINHGYGLSTLLYWQQHPPSLQAWPETSESLPSHHRVCSSLDAIAQYWTHSPSIMGESLAHSLGLLDMTTRTWLPAALVEAGLDELHTAMLPKVVKDGRTGHPMQAPHSQRLGLPVGVRVLVPFGDNQAQTYGLAAVLPSTKPSMFVNLGTSCQLTVIATPEQASRIQVGRCWWYDAPLTWLF